MADPKGWRGVFSGSPVLRARALAAAGTLTAAGWKPGDGNYSGALASIIKQAGPGPVRWLDPTASAVLSPTPPVARGLADAWTAAFLARTRAADPRRIARIAVEPPSQATAAARLGYIDTYHQLLTPWLNRLDDGKPGQIAAVSLNALDQTQFHDWNWPVRVGLAGPEDQSLSRRMNAIGRVRPEFDMVPRRAPGTDVLLSDLEILEAAEALQFLQSQYPGLAILYSDRKIDGGMIDRIAAKISAPTAVIDMSAKTMSKFLGKFAAQIGDNKPLDVALFEAYRSVLNPKGGQGDALPPLVLLAPKTNQGTAFEAVKVRTRVQDLVNRLESLPKGAVVGSPPRGSDQLGIGKDAYTVNDYVGQLSRAMTDDNLEFARGSVLRSTARAVAQAEASHRGGQPDHPLVTASASAQSRSAGATQAAGPPEEASPPDGPADFSAYPRLDAPATAEAKKSFEIEVGFSDVAYPGQSDEDKITISDAEEDEKMMVVVAPINGKVVGDNVARLKLKLDAAAKFTIEPDEGCDSVTVPATYLFRGEPVGSVARTVMIAGQPAEAPPPILEVFRPVVSTVKSTNLDLVLMIHREGAERITWQAIKGETYSAPITVDVGDARQFASQLDQTQRGYEYEGYLGHNAVEVIGADIEGKIPGAIKHDYLAPLLKAGTPRILILTNEPYIPWELALLDPEITGKDKLEYFGALARIGRWWVEDGMGAPAPSVRVEKMTVVAADNYIDQRQLPEAKAEREWLSNKFSAIPAVAVLGNLEPVTEWLLSLPVGPGHLAHFALHGYSNPVANDQTLILGDGKSIYPGGLSGTRAKSAKIPRFEMVFLNCCQVGNAAMALGQFAGFPGRLLKVGTNAVIGPIWEVNDAAAHSLVKNFYDSTFDQRVPVSETLRQIRANRDPKKTTTPLAYIFYGHPDLTLSQ